MDSRRHGIIGVMRRSGRPALLVATLVVALAAACGGSGPPARGFRSRQLLTSSDPTLSLYGWGWGSLFYSLGVDANGIPTSKFRVDLMTGVSTPDSDVPTAGGDRFRCDNESNAAGQTTLTITDLQSGQTTSIEGGSSLSSCPKTPEQVITLWRIDAAKELTLLSGPYEHLAPVATGLRIHGVVRPFIDYEGYSDLPAVVRAAPEAEPESVGLHAIAPKTFQVKEIIAGKLTSAALATGGIAAGELSSSRLGVSVRQQGRDTYVYSRVMSDGHEVYFVGPFDDGPRELAVAPVSSTIDPSVRLQFPRGGPWSWLEPGTVFDSFRAWDDVGRRLVSCPWPSSGPVSATTSPDGRSVLVGGGVSASTNAVNHFDAETALLLMSFDGAAVGQACFLLAAHVTSAGFSRDGSNLYWVIATPNRQAELWVADGDGTNPVLVGKRSRIENAHFLDDKHLELTLEGDLLWLDVDDPAPEKQLHYVADNTFGYPLDFGGSSTITGYDFNPAEGIGKLAIVDRNTGAKQFISASVSKYSMGLVEIPGSTSEAWFGYVVRGRHPSAQDGLWVATLPIGDLR
jgi:hypothetical protein